MGTGPQREEAAVKIARAEKINSVLGRINN